MATKAEKAYMNKMAEYGCIVCRNFEDIADPPPCNIHHIRDHTGMGRKDSEMIPLCHYHHQGKMGIHTIGKETWEEKYATQRNLREMLIEEIG